MRPVDDQHIGTGERRPHRVVRPGRERGVVTAVVIAAGSEHRRRQRARVNPPDHLQAGVLDLGGELPRQRSVGGDRDALVEKSHE